MFLLLGWIFPVLTVRAEIIFPFVVGRAESERAQRAVKWPSASSVLLDKYEAVKRQLHIENHDKNGLKHRDFEEIPAV